MANTDLSQARAAAVEAAWPDVLAAIAAGARVDKTCERFKVDRMDLWRYWAGDPARRQQYMDALRHSADALLDQILECADMATEGMNAKGARVRANILQWAAEKRDPERYGQRMRNDINVKTVDLTAIIKDAQARVAAAQQARLIGQGSTDGNRRLVSAHTHAPQSLEQALDPAVIGALQHVDARVSD